MYRIEVAPGEVTVFRTLEELAIGIRNGVITARARIYHHASQKWLPIGLHPHYKKALEMPAASTGAAPVTTATPIPTPPRLKAHPHGHPRPHSEVHYPEPVRSPEPKRAPGPGSLGESAVPPEIPAPRPSPVLAMQHEILRDLPVVSIPEPLPWHVPAPHPAAPPVEPSPPVAAAPARRTPAAGPPVVRAPAPFAPLEFVVPVEEQHCTHYQEPLLPRPTARRSRRLGSRPLLLLGTAAALVIGTHVVLTSTPSVLADPSEQPVTPSGNGGPDDVSLPPSAGDGEPAAEAGWAETTAAEAPRVTIAPARVPMVPGPAFAGSAFAGAASARPGADSTPTPKSPRAPVPGPAVGVPSITPAPAAIEVALPDLQSDPVVPAVRTGDTLGMKKILRALNGTKRAEAPAAE
jgi:hypothetical protein